MCLRFCYLEALVGGRQVLVLCEATRDRELVEGDLGAVGGIHVN